MDDINSKKVIKINNKNLISNVDIYNPKAQFEEKKVEKNNNVKRDKIRLKKEDKKNKNKNEQLPINKVESNKTEIDLDDIDYEKALLYDKRNYFRMYFSFLVDSQIIFTTFCTENHLHLFIIKLSFFVYTIIFMIILNIFIF